MTATTTTAAGTVAFKTLVATAAVATAAAKSKTKTRKNSTSIFDRLHEREQLDALLCQSPASIRVVLGPRSCGKSTFVEDFVLQQKLSNSICYLDCRMFAITTPDGFAEVLVQQGLPALIRNIDWEQWEQVKKPVLAVADMFSVIVPWGFGSEVTFSSR
jgi:hypothetical protein